MQVAGVRPLAPTFAATTLRAGEGSDPIAPNSVSLAAVRSARGFGRRSRALGPAPDDLLTSYPGLGARAPCSVASAPARALVWSAHRPWPSADFGFAASGPRAGAWMVCPPTRRGIRTAAPGSCAEGRFQDRRRLISEARAEKHISQPPSCSACVHHQPKNLSPGIDVVGRNRRSRIAPILREGGSAQYG